MEHTLREAAVAAGVELEIRPDRHFLCSRVEFGAHLASRKQLRMEYFYREMRRRQRVLMEGDKPVGGARVIGKILKHLQATGVDARSHPAPIPSHHSARSRPRDRHAPTARVEHEARYESGEAPPATPTTRGSAGLVPVQQHPHLLGSPSSLPVQPQIRTIAASTTLVSVRKEIPSHQEPRSSLRDLTQP